MKKGLKKFVVFNFLPVFVGSALLCCCSFRHAEASSCDESSGMTEMSDSVAGYQSAHETCLCSCKQHFVANKEKSQLSSLSFDKKVSPFFLVKTMTGPVMDRLVYCESPPEPADSSPPLYLLNRVLRL